MTFEKKMEYTKLYDIYYLLLTEKQQEIFELYCDEDYTVSEIAAILKVHRSAVSRSLKSITMRLLELEEYLQVEEHYNKNIELLKKHNIDEEVIKKIKK